MRKQLTLVFISIFFISCLEKKETESNEVNASNSIELSIRENLKIKDGFEEQAVKIMKEFFSIKNENLYQNIYWSETDFQKYIYPYNDIYRIEEKDSIKNYYQPQLIDIVNTENENQKLFKIAFIGVNNNQPIIRSIYNILVRKDENISFQRPLDYLTKDWAVNNIGNIKYVISPYRKLNKKDVEKQFEIERLLSSYFDLEPIKVTYYSCKNPKELFEIKGFDYNPMMYVSQTGGLAESNIIFSANNSEFYAHELTHIYSQKRFPRIPKLLDEGFAMLVGGSGVFDYEFHRENLIKYLKETSDVNFSNYIEPYQRKYIYEETSIPYMVGAILCELILKEYGKEKLFELFQSEEDLWINLNKLGVTRENLDYKLKFVLKNYEKQRIHLINKQLTNRN